MDLRRDEFQLWDQGKQRPIVQFSVDTRPITVLILVDNSGSTYASEAWRLRAVDGFVSRLQSNDRAGISTLTQVIQPLTSDITELQSAGRRAAAKDRYSPIWQATANAITDLEPLTGFRAVLLLTDALDTSSPTPPESLAQAAHRADVVLYNAVLDNPMGSAGNTVDPNYQLRVERAQQQLKDLVRSTGGRSISIRGTDQVERVFRGITDELRHRYVIGFQPAALDGKYHQIRMRATRPNITVNARTGYFAIRQN
jgi:Ca-activated chloride channel family protein